MELPSSELVLCTTLFLFLIYLTSEKETSNNCSGSSSSIWLSFESNTKAEKSPIKSLVDIFKTLSFPKNTFGTTDSAESSISSESVL